MSLFVGRWQRERGVERHIIDTELGQTERREDRGCEGLDEGEIEDSERCRYY